MSDAPAKTGTLPPLYARWMREALPGEIQGEPPSTCDDCAMCPPKGAPPAASEFFFDPSVKCCTYIPELPNYLVGRILADADPALQTGRESVLKRLREGVGVTPLGIARPRTFDVLYKRSQGTFGRSRSFRCPHYVDEGGGRCGIWKHRASVCATWWCKHERGAVGHAFWRALDELLSCVQNALARWCVRDLDPGTLRALFAPAALEDASGSLGTDDLEGRASPVSYAAAWGAWAGREEEFFIGCGRAVETLSWAKVREIGGAELHIRERLLRAAWERLLSKDIPGRLRPGPFQVVHSDPQFLRVVTYSENQPVEVRGGLLGLLGFFDGRPTAEVLRTIAKERNVEVPEDRLRWLVDFRMLVPFDE